MQEAIDKGGVSRSHAKSTKEKWTFIVLHFSIILFAIWLVLFGGLSTLGTLVSQEWSFSDPTRATVLLAVSALYFLRHILTLFYLLTRKVAWGEVFGLITFMALFEIGLLLIAGGSFRDHSIAFGWLDIIALMLILIGSYLNSFSELERKWWKQDSLNKGRVYTKGLFSHSMHINFFGDVVLFIGWTLLTYNFWTFVLPLFMALMFIFFHIPALDEYLRGRYGKEFVVYEQKTKKLIPFVY